MSENYENMTNREIKEQLEWSDHHEFSYNYAIWAFEEIDRLTKEYERMYNELVYSKVEIDRLDKEYERIYNENCKLRENHNINDITLLDENERLNRIIDNIFKFMQNKYDNSDLTGFTISFMELQDLKALKENKQI